MKIENPTSSQLKLRLIPVFFWMFAGICAAAALFFIISINRETTLTCNRTKLAQGSCKVVQSDLLGSKVREIPLSTLQGAKVNKRFSTNGTTYESETNYEVVLLTTANREVPFADYSYDEIEKQEVIASRINDFFKITGEASLIVKQRPLEQGEEFWIYLLGGLCFATCFTVVYHSPIETYLFDKTLGSFTVKRQGLFGTEVIEHRICEIVDVQVEECELSEGTIYSVRIVLLSGDHLTLTNHFNSDNRKSQQKTASYIRKFLNLDEQVLG